MAKAEHLEVLLNHEHVATLTKSRFGLVLSYTDSAVSAYGLGGVCLSMALLVTKKKLHGDTVHWWVEALLPEGEARTLLEDRFGVQRGDTFGLLKFVGRDCAGAVSFHTDAFIETPAELTPVSQARLEWMISELPTYPLGADEEVPVSLAGLQSKLLLVRTETGWARPANGHPSTHILKPDPFQRPGLIAAEALTMTAAKLAGLDVADVELQHIGGRDVLVVRRFDRRDSPKGPVRIHQEDGGQALGLDPSHDFKYERAGHRVNPSYGKLASLLLDHAADPLQEQVKLAQTMVLHIASGNTDAHVRNHGFLLERGVARLAPIYDAAPTIEFSNTTRCALNISGQDVLDRVTRVHLQLEARSWTPLRDRAQELVVETASALARAFAEAAAVVPGVSAKIVERMQQRALRLAS
jgi:serine/threonine-protein kinase HipA